MPLFWSKAVFFSSQASLDRFSDMLLARSLLSPNATHPRWHLFGCYVRTLDLTYLTSSSLITDLPRILFGSPRLSRIYLGNGQLSPNQWHNVGEILAHARIESLRAIHLPHSRPETAAFLDLLNGLPELEELSATSLCLQVDLSLSLIEIFKMNALLVSLLA